MTPSMRSGFVAEAWGEIRSLYDMHQEADAHAISRAVRTLHIDVRAISLWLWGVAGAVVVLALVGGLAAGVDAPYSITRFVDSDVKTNIPSTYKILALLAALLLFLARWRLARTDSEPSTRLWAVLTGVTFFAFVDEATYLHQTLSEGMHEGLGWDGPLRFAWVVVYVPALIAVGIVVLHDLPTIEARVRMRLLVAGVLYGLGTIAMEPIKSAIADGRGEVSVAFKLTATTSDCLQVVGLTLLVLLLAGDVARRAPRVDVRVR